MTQRTLQVTTIGADGKSKVEHVAMSPEMVRLADEMKAAWDEHGCKCDPQHPDHIHLSHRGHSVDVACTDCGGWRQIG